MVEDDKGGDNKGNFSYLDLKIKSLLKYKIPNTSFAQAVFAPPLAAADLVFDGAGVCQIWWE